MQEKNNMELYPGWKTVKRIGVGSFGTVFEIERDHFGRTEKAALKHISIPRNDGDVENLYANGYDDEGVTAHFKDTLEDIVREYSLMAEMKGHPNIVYCDDIRYIQHDDGFGWDIFIKMELLTPMTKALGPTVSDDEVIKIGKDICNALVLCKSKGVVHRDIKPQNIFVSPTGDYKLGDFGIAKTVERTTGGTQAGTLAYMAPEVANFQPYGSSADIYSLGLVLYWLLNERRLPFLPLPPERLKTSMDDEAKKRRLSGEPIPAPAQGSEDLKKIVLKACAYDPKDRYATAAEMLQDLRDGFDSAELLRKQEEERRRREEEERLRRETEEARKKAEEERRRKEEAERLAREKVEREAKERAERERRERERLEQERLRKLREEEKEQEKPIHETKQSKKTFTTVACVLVAIIAVICFFTIHSWTEATCTEPAVCQLCGKIGEEAKGHQWNAASCTLPKTCEVCGTTEGDVAGHNWTAADGTHPKTCAVCGVIDESETEDTMEFNNASSIPDEMTSSDGKYQVAFITDVGQLKDKSFNQGTYDGVKLYAANNGKSYKYYQPANGDQATDEDRIAAFDLACSNGAEVVVAAGFMQAAALQVAAEKYPDVHFVFIDGWPLGFENVAAIAFKEEQSGYLAGYATVMEGYTKLGFTGGGGGTNPACCRFGYGFVQGAEAAAAKKGVKVEINYSWSYGSNFTGSPELQSMATGWYQNGTEVIFACGGSMFQSVASAASAEDGKVVGANIDQSYDSNTVITSAMKDLSVATIWAVTKHYNGEWGEIGGIFSTLGIKENAVCLPTDNWILNNWPISSYRSFLNAIISNEIHVSDELVEYPKSTENVTVLIIE